MSNGILIFNLSGAGGASNSAFCSNHIIYKSMSASDVYSWFWCDTAPLTGYIFYVEEPQQPTLENPSTPVTSDATTTSLFSIGSSLGTSNPTETVTMDSPHNYKGLNIGAIAGGVIGGVAILGAAGFAVFFLLLHKKHNKPGRDSTGYQQPYQQPEYGDFGRSAYQESNQKPPGVQEVRGYAQHTQHIQPYPSGPYDPHQSQCPANLTNTAYSAGSRSHYEAPVSTLTEVAELPSQQQ
ncbi:hypothetical protein BS50DRAFT_222441 [Corynespora cassiicola Philippines]|uniref:Uncharacterized protein n=1 Tax=Corynespora cassiicola Philippines TaxID=1448308 RepID=A0A2T2N353_CORCC|nr:hypothetical protein BS50DRAFT_222441 [Corynespora cassiicola Philippines]